MGVRMLFALLASVVVAGVGAGSALAWTVSPTQLGVNISHNAYPADLTAGWPGAGVVGVARREVIDYTNWTTTTDQLVTKLWQAGLRLAPDLGLPCPSSYSSQTNCPYYASESVSSAANDMKNFVTAFAQRYGPGGTFWTGKLNPLPVEQYEIGDEPNIPMQWIQDETHLHWGETSQTYGPESPASYAAVYEASEQALQNLHLPGPVEAVVGGFGDSGSLGVDLNSTEAMLGGITGTVDAVAFHPYTWQTNNDFAAMESDVVLLRQYMSSHGMSSTPIEINEFDACSNDTGQGCTQPNLVVPTSSQWGAFVSSYTTWALCTPGLNVGSVVPFIWGDTSDAPTEFHTLVDSTGALTPYGQDFLATATTLTTSGCPPPSSVPPPVLPPGSTGGGPSGSPAPAAPGRPTATLHILHIHVHGSYVTVEIQVSYGNHSVKVVAVKGHHRIRFHVIKRRHWRTLLWLTAKLFHGKWTLNVTCVPPSGYATPPARHHTVTIRR